MKPRLFAAVLPVLLAACASDGSTPLESRSLLAPACEQPAPLLGAADAGLPDSYIVVFTSAVNDAAAATDDLARRYGFMPKYVYDSALDGFAAMLPADVLESVRCEPLVDYVEHDQRMHLDDL